MQIIVRTGNVFSTSQVDGWWHGSSAAHGFWQRLFKQASCEAQSPSSRHSARASAWQKLYGLPVVPGGHLHNARWLRTLHWASGAHGLSYTHGFMHCALMHDRSSGQSLLLRHPTT
jgi:hypothetical protein